jgi:hypothetical protein
VLRELVNLRCKTPVQMPIRYWSCRALRPIVASHRRSKPAEPTERPQAPYYFVATPAHVDDFLHAHLGELTYGWGGIPAQVRIGDTEVTTSLMPKDGVYLVPLKVALRRAEGIEDGDDVRVRLQVGRQNVPGPCEGTGMTTFVIDAQVAINLATGGATIPPQHSLTAPTLLRSQALALVYESVHRGEIDERAGRKNSRRYPWAADPVPRRPIAGGPRLATSGRPVGASRTLSLLTPGSTPTARSLTSTSRVRLLVFVSE